MKRIISAAVLMTSVHLSAATPKFTKDQLIVKFNTKIGAPYLENSTKTKHLFGSLYVIHTNDIEKLKKELDSTKLVEYVENNYYSGRKSLPTPEKEIQVKSQERVNFSQFNDPRVGRVWSFNDASKSGVSVNKAYSEIATAAREEVIVAVVDTGITPNHEDLRDVVWTNPREIAGNGIDDDANGYIDDIHGINTLSRDANGNATGDVRDTHGHGTHVSGTIGATQNNSRGIAGIASNVKIIGIKTVPNSGDETDIDVAESFLYAAKMGAKIINCSFGKSHNEGGLAVQETIDYIGKHYGVLVVAAAGNDSQNIDRNPKYPAAFLSDNLLVVASTTSRGRMSYFSNFGIKSVDIAAPGSGVYSTVPRGYANMSGTSMASPTAAGVAAEVLSRHPNLGPLQLKDILIKSVTKVGRFSRQMVSGGRVDLYETLKLLE